VRLVRLGKGTGWAEAVGIIRINAGFSFKEINATWACSVRFIQIWSERSGLCQGEAEGFFAVGV